MIILSIPYIKTLELPKDYKGWKEFRLDFNPDPESFPEKLIDEETILTIRDRNEGGIHPFPIKKKVEIYQHYINNYNCLIDLELSNNHFAAKIPNNNLILSWHCFSDQWSLQEVKDKIKLAISHNPRFVKIALTISTYTQLKNISELLASTDYPVIFVGMGTLGKQSRLLYNQLNSKATYIGLEENGTAPGQLSHTEARLYNLAGYNSQTKIGGLIGTQQVYDSLGLKFYNNYFRQNDINASYLPFPVDNLENFLEFVASLKNSFYGFSITMPHKSRAADLLKADLPMINLYLPKSDKTFNTDRTAFLNSLEILHIRDQDKILVYGNGATAKLALDVLTPYPNVWLKCRNRSKQINLKKRFNSIHKNEPEFYDLIINCTPLGMQDEDFYFVTGISPAKKIIDLPYSQHDTPLIDFCKREKLEFVDGKLFWEMQAEEQLKAFLKILN